MDVVDANGGIITFKQYFKIKLLKMAHLSSWRSLKITSLLPIFLLSQKGKIG